MRFSHFLHKVDKVLKPLQKLIRSTYLVYLILHLFNLGHIVHIEKTISKPWFRSMGGVWPLVAYSELCSVRFINLGTSLLQFSVVGGTGAFDPFWVGEWVVFKIATNAALLFSSLFLRLHAFHVAGTLHRQELGQHLHPYNHEVVWEHPSFYSTYLFLIPTYWSRIERKRISQNRYSPNLLAWNNTSGNGKIGMIEIHLCKKSETTYIQNILRFTQRIYSKWWSNFNTLDY